MAIATEVEIEGKRLALSNLDKVLYPETGFTKGQMIDYYVRIAPVLLPHLQGRPLTLKRYPNGTSEAYFYEKRCPPHHPDWVHTVAVWSRSGGSTVEYCSADDLATLAWLANLAAVELHPLLARGDDIDSPTALVFDLDPGPPAGVVDCARVALWCRDALADVSLASWVKTSGSKGLQVYVPLNCPHTYDDTKPFAHHLAQRMEKDHPEAVVEKMDKARRRGKVLIDWSQNHVSKTTISVYSLRARARPTVSTPVTWAEVEQALADGRPEHLVFEAGPLLDRVAERGDLFEPVLQTQQRLPSAQRGGR